MWTLRCRGLPDEKYDDLVSHQADALAGLFWTRLGEFLQRTLGEHDLTPIEKQCWIQSGLALSPLMATCTQYFLIGEWASCILLPVPRGPWPRHGHTDALLPEYRARSPRFVDWASCFCPLYSSCKGWCLSSHCLGIRCFSRLALVKEGSGLQSCMHMEVPRQEWQKRYDLLQVRGGCHLLLPWWAHRASYRWWADPGLRPVIGTTVDIKVAPVKSVSGCALNTWLSEVRSEYGPECEDSPHFRRRNIDLLEATRLLHDSGFQFLPEMDLQGQPVMETVMSVGLRLCALEFTPQQLKTLAYLAVTGLLPDSFPHAMWVQAVQRSKGPFALRKWQCVRIELNGMTLGRCLNWLTLFLSLWYPLLASLYGLGEV